MILSGKNDEVLMWYVNAAFVVHPNMCGHTGGGLRNLRDHIMERVRSTKPSMDMIKAIKITSRKLIIKKSKVTGRGRV